MKKTFYLSCTTAFILLLGFNSKAQGLLDVTVNDNAVQTNVNLSDPRNTDWAIWGTGTSTSLSPDHRKNTGSGSSLISNLTPLFNLTAIPTHGLRGLGQFGAFSHTFQWADGTPLTTSSNTPAGIQVLNEDYKGEDEGFLFQVPAQPYEQTLVIYAGHHEGAGLLTGTISDLSAPDITEYAYTNSANTAVVFTIKFKSVLPDQYVTFNWKLLPTFGQYSNVQLFAVTLANSSITAPDATFTEQTGAVNPFNGVDVGSNAAPTFADIDNDGKIDAFIGAADGTVKFYKNTGTNTAPVYVAQSGASNPLNGLSLGSGISPTFVDIDNDGKKDAFVGAPDGTVKFYKNTGTAAAPLFTLQSGASNPLNGLSLGAGVAPNFVDIDNDGKKDAFIGAPDGTVKFYKNTGTYDAPAFTELSGGANPFSSFDVGDSAIPAFLDIDKDGDIDAVVGGSSGIIKYYKITGTADNPVFVEQTGLANPFNGLGFGGAASPRIVDIDNDGNNDVFVGSSDGTIRYFKNISTPIVPDVALVEQTGVANPFNGVDVGSNAAPTFVDIDNDGKRDAFIGASDGTVKYYKNTGTNAAPVFTQQSGGANPLNGLSLVTSAAPTFVDIDNDGKKDAFIGALDGTVKYYKNTGTVSTPVFTEQTGGSNPLNSFGIGNNVTPTFGDLDSDGDNDVFVGGSSGTIKYYKNTGSVASPMFTEQTGGKNPFYGLSFGGAASPNAADIKNNGIYDLFVGTPDGTIRYYKTLVNCGSYLTPSLSIAASPGSSITSGTSVTFTASPSNGGLAPDYQWKKGSTNVGTNSATYTDAALANGDVISCLMTSNSPCASPTTATSNSITMTVTTPCVTPTAYTLTGGGAYCAGGTGVAVELSNSESGVTYQLKNGATDVGTPVNGTGAAISFGNQTAAATYTVVATRTVGACTSTMTGSAVVSVNILPTAYTVTGSKGVAIGIPNSETGVTYQLKKDAIDVGTAVAGTNAALSFGIQTATGTYTVVATRTADGCTASMTGSVAIIFIPFITTWKTDNPGTSNSTSITIPTTGTGYLYEVDWDNDGTFEQTGVTGNVTHDYGAAGTYTVAIRGAFPRIYFNNDGDRNKILSIEQWGDIAWTSMANAFMACESLVGNASDAPNLSVVTDMSYMFKNASAFNQNIGSWNVSAVTNMSHMFGSASSFNQNIGVWNVSAVTDMSGMFLDASSFNQNINSWNVSGVTNMSSMFAYASVFDGNIGSWNVSAVTNMFNMFGGASSFNQNIGAWNVSTVTDMSGMFLFASSFNQNIGAWNVSGVTNMSNMFRSTSSFNQNIGAWNVSGVSNMSNMFDGASSFNQNIGAWNVNAVANMSNIFKNSGISQPNYDAILIAWDAAGYSNKTLDDASPLEYCAGAAARDNMINTKGWMITGDALSCPPCTTPTAYNVTGGGAYCSGGAGVALGLDNSETGVSYQLKNGATDVGTPVNGTGTAISFGNQTAAATYSVVATRTTGGCTETMTGSAAVTINPTVTPAVSIASNDTDNSITSGTSVSFTATPTNGGTTPNYQWKKGSTNVGTNSATYTDATLANGDVISCVMTSNDPCASPTTATSNSITMTVTAAIFRPFITTWKTNNPGTSSSTSITIPTFGGGYLYDVDWNNDGTFEQIGVTGNVTHNYGTAGTYTVAIRGAFPRISFNNSFDRGKILSIEQWGDIPWTSMENAFFGCNNLAGNASDAPILSGVTNMSNMFNGAQSFNQNIGSWNVSAVTNMSKMFNGAVSFNQNIGSWNVSAVTNMSFMLAGASTFNQNIGSWNVGAVTNMSFMLAGASAFNQNIGSWNVSAVTDMLSLFDGATSFNQNIGAWNVSAGGCKINSV